MNHNPSSYTLNAYQGQNNPEWAVQKTYRRVSIRNATLFDHSDDTPALDPVIHVPVETPGVVP